MPADLQPVLKGELLELRPLRPADFDELFAVAADPRIWEQHPASDRWREEVFRDFFREALESGGALAAVDAATGRIIGSSRFHGYDPARREVEIGWTFLARTHWGGRYNGEMKRLMLRHAFGFADRVLFLVGPLNRRSRRAVEKLGGVETGTRRGADGRESVVYEITAAAYLPAEIVPFEDAHAGAFYALNRAWLDAHGLYEPADERQLADPRGRILRRGGDIFVAVAGGRVVGTAALVPCGPGVVEIAKVTVAEDARGRGLGRRLAEHCIAHARLRGARRMVLVSSTRLGPALRLYESLGFVHRPPPAALPYETADVYMELELEKGPS